MKNLIIVILSFLTFYGCGKKAEETVTSTADNSRPLGQASVVDEESAKNILQIAIGSEVHSTLVAAVQAAQIEHVLVNAGPLTVFAPVNDAFSKLPAGTVDELLLPENKGKLAAILTGHAAPGKYDIEGLEKESRKGRKLYMASGDYLEIIKDGNDLLVGGAKIIGTVEASNGIIHVVDQIILSNK